MPSLMKPLPESLCLVGPSMTRFIIDTIDKDDLVKISTTLSGNPDEDWLCLVTKVNNAGIHGFLINVGRKAVYKDADMMCMEDIKAVTIFAKNARPLFAIIRRLTGWPKK
ncbi:MAG: hypothetical protein WD898_03995 [Candidatus Paceibacterota bacterium]